MKKQLLADYLGATTNTSKLPQAPKAGKAQTKVNNVKGSPRYGLPYIEVQIGGRTVHRYAADGSQDVAADTARFRPNTGTTRKPSTRDAQPGRKAALAEYLKAYSGKY